MREDALNGFTGEKWALNFVSMNCFYCHQRDFGPFVRANRISWIPIRFSVPPYLALCLSARNLWWVYISRGLMISANPGVGASLFLGVPRELPKSQVDLQLAVCDRVLHLRSVELTDKSPFTGKIVSIAAIPMGRVEWLLCTDGNSECYQWHDI